MMEDVPEASILMLNDYCLLEIFSYMNVLELGTLERVCKRFSNVVQRSYKTYRKLNFYQFARNDKLSLAKAENIARRVGPYVHHLKLSRTSIIMQDDCLPLSLMEHFKSLQIIFLRRFNCTSASCIEMLGSIFGTIEKAYFWDCTLNDNISACLLKSNQIHTLQLNDISGINGKCLQGLTGMTSLDLCNCSNIEPQYFQQCCEANPGLLQLNIFRCKRLDRFCMQAIATNLKNLKSITLSDLHPNVQEEDFAVLGDLKGLFHVELCYFALENSDKFDLFYQKLIQLDTVVFLSISAIFGIYRTTMERIGQFRSLKVLHVAGVADDMLLKRLSCLDTLVALNVSESDVTAAGLKKVILKSPTLRRIDLSKNPIGFKFLKSIGNHLVNRTNELELVVNETPICDVLANPTIQFYNFIKNKFGKIKFITPTLAGDSSEDESEEY